MSRGSGSSGPRRASPPRPTPIVLVSRGFQQNMEYLSRLGLVNAVAYTDGTMRYASSLVFGGRRVQVIIVLSNDGDQVDVLEGSQCIYSTDFRGLVFMFSER
jgi:hypothetical protein